MDYLIGQAAGLMATTLSVVTPLLKRKGQMLVSNFLNNFMLALNMLFLKQIGSGIFLCLVAMAQAVVNLIHLLRNKQSRTFENGLFLLLYLGLGGYGLVTAPGFVPVVNGRNLLELLPILGAIMSMCFISTRNIRRARVFIMLCGAVWTLYFILIGSTAAFGTFFSVVTAVVGIVKNRKRD